MSTWAKPGVKCVCVKRGTWMIDDGSSRPGPMFGEICTIHAVETSGTSIILEGYRTNIGYDITRFRPLVTRTQEQDLEQFIPLLSTKPHEVDA